MANRFEDVPDSVLNLVERVREQWFPELARARIKVLFDTKKRMSRGLWVLARIQRTNQAVRHLTREEARSEEGFDYIIYIDKAVWEAIEEKERSGSSATSCATHSTISRPRAPPTSWWPRCGGLPHGDRAEQGRSPLERALRGHRPPRSTTATAPSRRKTPNQGDLFGEGRDGDGVISLEQKRAEAESRR